MLKPSNMWSIYEIQWDFITSLCSSVPANPDMIEGWLNARRPSAKPPGGKSINEIQEEVVATLIGEQGIEQELLERSSLVFQRQDGNLVIRAATIRAHMKDCARVISREVGKIKNEASWAVRFINTVYVDEALYWIPILSQEDDQPMKKPAGVRQKAIHTFRGSALKSFEYVSEARLRFKIKVLGNHIKQEDLETVFIYGGVHGYAGERSDGEGKYTFKIEKESANG